MDSDVNVFFKQRCEKFCLATPSLTAGTIYEGTAILLLAAFACAASVAAFLFVLTGVSKGAHVVSLFVLL